MAMNRAEEVEETGVPEGVCLFWALTATAVRLRGRSRSILYGRLSHTARPPAFIDLVKTAGLDIQNIFIGSAMIVGACISKIRKIFSIPMGPKGLL